jgi:hypothetical protein
MLSQYVPPNRIPESSSSEIGTTLLGKALTGSQHHPTTTIPLPPKRKNNIYGQRGTSKCQYCTGSKQKVSPSFSSFADYVQCVYDHAIGSRERCQRCIKKDLPCGEKLIPTKRPKRPRCQISKQLKDDALRQIQLLLDRGHTETEILERLDTESESDLTPHPGYVVEDHSSTMTDPHAITDYFDPSLNDPNLLYQLPSNQLDQPLNPEDYFQNVNLLSLPLMCAVLSIFLISISLAALFSIWSSRLLLLCVLVDLFTCILHSITVFHINLSSQYCIYIQISSLFELFDLLISPQFQNIR